MKDSMILNRLFLWALSTDTGLAVFSQVLMVISAYLGLSLFGETLLNPIIFGLIGTVGVCVILPLYWIVVVKWEKLDELGITKGHWLGSPIVSRFLGGFFFFYILSTVWDNRGDYPRFDRRYLRTVGGCIRLWLASTSVWRSFWYCTRALFLPLPYRVWQVWSLWCSRGYFPHRSRTLL